MINSDNWRKQLNTNEKKYQKYSCILSKHAHTYFCIGHIPTTNLLFFVKFRYFSHIFVEFCRGRCFCAFSKILARSLFSFPCLSQILSSTPDIHWLLMFRSCYLYWYKSTKNHQPVKFNLWRYSAIAWNWTESVINYFHFWIRVLEKYCVSSSNCEISLYLKISHFNYSDIDGQITGFQSCRIPKSQNLL